MIFLTLQGTSTFLCILVLFFFFSLRASYKLENIINRKRNAGKFNFQFAIKKINLLSNKYPLLYFISFLQLKILPKDLCLPFHFGRRKILCRSLCSSFPTPHPHPHDRAMILFLCVFEVLPNISWWTRTLLFLSSFPNQNSSRCYIQPSNLSIHLNLPQMRLHLESGIKNVSTERRIWGHLVQTYNLTQDDLTTQRG